MNELKPKEQKWISVDDRLPEKDGEYWIFVNGDVELDFFTNEEKGRNMWWTSGEQSGEFIANGWYQNSENNVTHWMPVVYPEPPKSN